MRSTIDRESKGGLVGENVRVISKKYRTVNIQGIDNHQCIDNLIVINGAVTRSQRVAINIVMNQYIYITGGEIFTHLSKC